MLPQWCVVFLFVLVSFAASVLLGLVVLLFFSVLFFSALMGKPLDFWRRRLCHRKKGSLVMIQSPMRPVDHSFLLGSLVSFLDSPEKEDVLLPSKNMSTSVVGVGIESLSPIRDLCGCNLEGFKIASLGELG